MPSIVPQVKHRITISSDPEHPNDERCSLTISITGLSSESEAKQIIRKLSPSLAKYTGQATLTSEE
jgi:hypothetical protein